jgi:multisubunit Na+/H+ antiporter MnhF subunit
LTPLNKHFDRFDETPQIRDRVVSRNTTGLMSQQILTIFKAHTSRPQTVSNRKS